MNLQSKLLAFPLLLLRRTYVHIAVLPARVCCKRDFAPHSRVGFLKIFPGGRSSDVVISLERTSRP